MTMLLSSPVSILRGRSTAYRLTVVAEVLAELKPRFIYDPRVQGR